MPPKEKCQREEGPLKKTTGRWDKAALALEARKGSRRNPLEHGACRLGPDLKEIVCKGRGTADVVSQCSTDHMQHEEDSTAGTVVNGGESGGKKCPKRPGY